MSDYTVLLPLDGDETSEDALRVLPMLRTIGFSKVRFISVDSPKNMKTPTAAAFSGYLAPHVATATAAGWEVETVIAEGDPVDLILDAASKDDVDLILLATHGRTGLERIRLGSVSDKLIKNALCPRLVVGPNVDIDMATYSLKRILVPVDGSDLSEESLPIARHLAKLVGAEIDLIQAVSITSGMVVGDTGAGADLMPGVLESANTYLARVAEAFPGQKVNTNVVVGNAADSIVEHLDNNPVDLVVIASRGRTGFTRFALSSVTERILQGPDPVLVFERGEDRSRLFDAARSA